MSVALSSLIIPYSWETVNDVYNNKTFQIIYNGTTYTLTLPNGNYSVADINAYVQYWCIQNNLLYCVSSSGQYVYFLEIVDNPVIYAYELRTYPTVLPSGATNPGGWTLNGFCPQFNLLNNNFTKIIGINSGSYPPVNNRTTNYTKASDFAPSPSPINQLTLNCSLVNNRDLQSSAANIIYSFTPTNTSYGSNIVIQPSEYAWIKCTDNIALSSISVWIQDQDGNPIYLKDSNSLIMLLIKSD